ncbi:hypothetical protein JYG30_20285 [Fibrella sp. USSR17]
MTILQSVTTGTFGREWLSDVGAFIESLADQPVEYPLFNPLNDDEACSPSGHVARQRIKSLCFGCLNAPQSTVDQLPNGSN